MAKGAEIWVALAGPLIGYIAAMFSEALRDRRQGEREREARREADVLARAQRSDDFQRETLLDLQDALYRLMRTTAQIDMANEVEIRELGTWGRRPLSDEINNASHQAGIDINRLVPRVLDEEVRQRVDSFKGLAAKASIGALRVEDDRAAMRRSKQALDRMIVEYQVVNETIGNVLRRLI